MEKDGPRPCGPSSWPVGNEGSVTTGLLKHTGFCSWWQTRKPRVAICVPAGKSNTHPFAAGSTGGCVGRKLRARPSLSRLLL